MTSMMTSIYEGAMMLLTWVDGYAELTGKTDDILSFITTRLLYQRNFVKAKIEGNHIVFPKDFIPQDLSLLGAERAFIGFEQRHDIEKTDIPDVYKVSVTWDQASCLLVEELTTIATRYNLAIEAEGIAFDLEFKQHIIVNNLGILLLEECIEYHHEDYDPYDDYKKVR